LNYPVIIDQVALLDGRLVVGAQFWEPGPNLASGAAITHPVHMVRIDKQDLPPGPLVLDLQPRRFIMGPASPPSAGAGFTPFTTTLMLDEVGAGIAPAAMQSAPQVRLLNSPEELAAVADQIDPQQLADAQIDWSGDALVGVWRGRQDGCHFRTVIEWVVVRNKQLSVYATFWQPAPIDAGCDMVTYPYHLVKVIRGQFAEVTEVKLATRSLQAPPVPQPIDVPFTTLLQDVLVAGPFLEQDYTPPHAVLVRTQEDAVRLASLLPPAAQPLALEVDYARYALVMLLRGSPGRPSYPIVIDRLTLLDGNLIVAAQMWLPPPGQESGQDLAQVAEAPITYPVHLALVAQDLLPPGLPSPTPLSLELRQMLVGQDGPAPQPVPAPASPLAPPSPLPGPSN
jgi:hypothetical protein